MSWAADSPEAYDEIVRKGITEKLGAMLLAYGFEDFDLDTLRMLVEVLEETQVTKLRNIYSVLADLSCHEISDAEADHFGSLVDAAESRGIQC